jgi:hypothetical protein
MRDIFVFKDIWVQDKIYIFVDTLLGCNMKLALFCNLNFTEVFNN